MTIPAHSPIKLPPKQYTVVHRNIDGVEGKPPTSVVLDNGSVIAETSGENAEQNAEKIVAALELWDNHCQNTARAAFIMGGF
jgi:hypothetical protein